MLRREESCHDHQLEKSKDRGIRAFAKILERNPGTRRAVVKGGVKKRVISSNATNPGKGKAKCDRGEKRACLLEVGQANSAAVRQRGGRHKGFGGKKKPQWK